MNKKQKYIMVLNTNPSIEDIAGTFEDSLEIDEDLIKEYLHRYNYDHQEEFTLENIPDEVKDEIMYKLYGNDNHLSQMYWDDETDYLQSLLKEKGYEDGNYLQVIANPCGWHGQEGHKEFQYNGKVEDFIRNTFACLDNNFYARITKLNKRFIEAIVSCHDIPTGARMTIKKVKGE